MTLNDDHCLPNNVLGVASVVNNCPIPMYKVAFKNSMLCELVVFVDLFVVCYMIAIDSPFFSFHKHRIVLTANEL